MHDLDAPAGDEAEDELGERAAGHQVGQRPDLLGERLHVVQPAVGRRLGGDQRRRETASGRSGGTSRWCPCPSPQVDPRREVEDADTFVVLVQARTKVRRRRDTHRAVYTRTPLENTGSQYAVLGATSSAFTRLYPVAVPSPPSVAVDGVSKTFGLPHEQVHTLKERALHPLRRTGCDDAARAARRLVRRAAGRVLRHRRAQRLGQVDAAEVPRRASTRPTRARSTSTAACRRSSSSASASTWTCRRATTSLINATMLGLTPARGAPRASTRSSTSPSCASSSTSSSRTTRRACSSGSRSR